MKWGDVCFVGLFILQVIKSDNNIVELSDDENKEVDAKIDEKVNNYMEIAEIWDDPKNRNSYFRQYTPESKKYSHGASIFNSALEGVLELLGKTNKI